MSVQVLGQFWQAIKTAQHRCSTMAASLTVRLCTGAFLRAPAAAAVAQHVCDLAADLLRLQQLRRLVIVVHVPRILLLRT